LTPMMCGRLLKPIEQDKPGRLSRLTEAGFQGMLGFYRRTLALSLRHQGFVLLVAVATLFGTIGMYVIVPKGFLPLQDTGVIVAVTEASQSISIPRMTALQAQAEAIVRKDPAVTGVVSFVGAGSINATPNTGRLTIALLPRRQRADSADVIAARLTRDLANIPGLSVFMQPVQDIQLGSRVSRTQYQYTLVDTDAAELNAWAPKLIAALQNIPILRDVTSDQQNSGLQTFINVDRDAAMRMGVTMQAVQDVLYDSFGQRQISTIFAQTNQYRVVLEADPAWQANPAFLSQLRVPSTAGAQAPLSGTGGVQAPLSGTAGAQVPLSAIASIERRTTPLAITHESQFPSVTISFNLTPTASLGEAVAAVAAAEQSIGLPQTISGSYSGDAAEFQRSLASEPWLILAAVVVIYIVLGVLYESMIHPITILSSLPSAGIGALLALMLVGSNLSLVALVGVVLLMGIVKKNAIMMIDFALDAERTRGITPEAAIVEACLLRFRPIMMTTAAALLGALPLVVEQGTGSELRFPLGVTIVGGLLLSQLLTLYTTPAIYLGLERLRLRLGGAPARPVPAE
jgi:multidrug efflux pump subunit AcrB